MPTTTQSVAATAVDVIKALSGLTGSFVALAVVVLGFIYRDSIRDLLRSRNLRVSGPGFTVDTGRATPLATTAPPAAAPPEDDSKGETPGKPSEPGADSEADDEHCLTEMLVAFHDGDIARADEAYKKFTELETDANKLSNIEIMYLAEKFAKGDASAEQRLIELADAPSTAFVARSWLGVKYREANAFDRAFDEFMAASKAAAGAETRTRSVVAAAGCLAELGRPQDGIDLIINALGAEDETAAQVVAFEGLAKRYERCNKTHLQVSALEKAIALKPTNRKLRFSLAYAYSEHGNHLMALFHYEILLRQNPSHGGALNNLAVAIGRLDAPMRATQSMKEAADLNNTMAMGNLAQNYINGGFADEARKLIDRARLADDPDANVGGALERLDEREQAEAKSVKRHRASARKWHQFSLRFADAYFAVAEADVSFEGNWIDGNETKVEVSNEQGKLIGRWADGGDECHFEGRSERRTLLGAWYRASHLERQTGKAVAKKGTAYACLADSRLFLLLIDGNSVTEIQLDRQ